MYIIVERGNFIRSARIYMHIRHINLNIIHTYVAYRTVFTS